MKIRATALFDRHTASGLEADILRACRRLCFIPVQARGTMVDSTVFMAIASAAARPMPCSENAEGGVICRWHNHC